jgi:sialate O-acetylesterase
MNFLKLWRRFGFLAAVVSFTGVLPVRAEVKLPAVLAEHMVLQRDLPVHLWGMAGRGELVSATFRGAIAKTQADKLGRWELSLPAGAAGGPFLLEIQGSNLIHFSDVLVGDVWLASGQSNMEFEMRKVANAEAELKNAERPRIRLFQVARASAGFAQADLVAETWTATTPESVARFSAVEYFFGREIQDAQKVPIGLIEADWGGSPAEAWTSLRGLSSEAGLMPAFAAHAAMTDREAVKLLEDGWERQEIAVARAAEKPEPDFPWHPEMRSWEPGGLYNAMIAPLTAFPLRGFLWYQGESNTSQDRAFYYAQLFQTLICDWRSRWAEGDIPFFFVQLANWNTEPEAQWPVVRDAQRRALELRNTGMAVAIDIGNPTDIHPTNKEDVGKRLALAARAIAYGEKIEYSGPLFRSAVPQGDSLRVLFDHADSGLVAKGESLLGFEIAGEDKNFQTAEARIEGETVILTSTKVASPRHVRYGWSGNPDCTLYNKAGLPAATFGSN